MEFVVVSIVALLASCLTLFSGFGLGTLLLPAFLIFFPAELSVAMTGIVHFLNNLFKLSLLGRCADFKTVLRFGAPAIVAAFVGAASLIALSDIQPITQYTIGERTFSVTLIKIVMAILIAVFASFETIPLFKNLAFDKKYLPLGGALSGFFGGLSGHQGALRSAFLVRAGLSKEAFIATGVVIACLIDITRLGVYARHFGESELRENIAMLAAATLSAFVGAYSGSKLLKKVTMNVVQAIVSTLLFIVAALLCLGIV